MEVAPRPLLEALHAEFNETVNLGILTDGRVLYLDMLESNHGLRTTAKRGARDPVHTTSLGKAMLAYLPRDEVEALLKDESFEGRTTRSIRQRKVLDREIELVRERGYSLDEEENEPGVRCVGAAIRDGSGRAIAAVSVSGPTWRLSDQVVAEMAQRLRTVVAQIEDSMGYRATREARAREE